VSDELHAAAALAFFDGYRHLEAGKRLAEATAPSKRARRKSPTDAG